jgi:hypothetical protein
MNPSADSQATNGERLRTLNGTSHRVVVRPSSGAGVLGRFQSQRRFQWDPSFLGPLSASCMHARTPPNGNGLYLPGCKYLCGAFSIMVGGSCGRRQKPKRLYPQGHRPVFGENRCAPYLSHFGNCRGLPPCAPFSRDAAAFASVLRAPPNLPIARASFLNSLCRPITYLLLT